MQWNCAPLSMSFFNETEPSCHVNIHHHAFKHLLHLKELDLKGNSLTKLPWLPESIRTLRLEDNYLFNIMEPFGTPYLQELFISMNCLHENPCYQSFYMHKDVYKELSNLKNLSLGYNNLTSIPEHLPPSLERLDLRENTLTEIPENAFAKLPNLQDLNLEWNCQRCDHAARPCFACPGGAPLLLHPNSFHAENSSMTFLSLRGNSLPSLPEGLFLPLINLNKLDLADNYLAQTISNATFFTELKQVKWISLIYNYVPLHSFKELELSPHLGNVSNLETLQLSGNFFSKISEKSMVILSRLKKLQILELRMNFILNYNMSSLGMLSSIINVDLSQNIIIYHNNCLSGYSLEQGFKGPDVLEYFPDSPMLPAHMDQIANEGDTCGTRHNFVFELSNFQHQFCKNQLTFDLSQNNLDFFYEDVFNGMEHVVCLNLSYNYASQALKSKIFSRLKSVVYLDLSYNRIDLYYRDVFSELNSTLKVLDLSQNEYHFRMKGMGHRLTFIRHLTNLEVLNMENNGIGMRIDPRLNSSSLKYMYFSGNHLNIMWEVEGQTYTHFFQDLKKLIYLDISRNELHSIKGQILCNLPVSLQTFSISNNNLHFFSWENITCLGNLAHLNLSGNKLSNLPAVINFPSNFSMLDLSNNRLTDLPDKSFSQATALQYLYLNDNSFKVLPLQSLPPLLINGNGQLLSLHNNNFMCDCDTAALVQFLLATNACIPALTTAVNCGFPESQHGKSVLTIEQHSCQEIYGGFAFLLSALFTCALTALPLLRHLYGWDVWYCLQILWAGCKGSSSGSCTQKRYDAFVVFDTANEAVRDWIYNELVVQLESSSYRGLSLCLEERDWIPGISCIDNLHHAIYSSEKTVFVLSSGTRNGGGGASVNGVIRQTFFMVQQRLLDEKVDVAVHVLLDKTFPKLKYLQLRKRLCGKSVMSWPRNPQAQPLFWNQMRTAISSDNLKLYDDNISKSFA